MLRVKILGSTGFVGKNLLAYLSAYFEVSVVTRYDLATLSPETFSDTDVVVHLIGKAHDVKQKSASDVYYKVNYELTKRVYEIFLLSNASKFIFMSSVKAAADEVDGELNEDMPENPVTHYGKSKLLAEQFIKQQIIPDYKKYYILRPCMIHGPGNKGNLNLLFKFISTGIPYPLAAYHNKRSFLSIENLCYLIKCLIVNDVLSGIYQMSDDTPLSTKEVVKILAKATSKHPKFWNISPELINTIAKIGDVLKLPLNSHRLQKLTESYVVSNKKIKASLDVELPVSAAEGLMATAKSFAK